MGIRMHEEEICGLERADQSPQQSGCHGVHVADELDLMSAMAEASPAMKCMLCLERVTRGDVQRHLLSVSDNIATMFCFKSLKVCVY